MKVDYRIMKITNMIQIVNSVYRVDYDIVGISPSKDDDELLKLAEKLNLPEDNYIVAEYHNDKYFKPAAMIFFNEVNPFVDVVEWDYKIICEVAHHPCSDAQIWKAMRESATKYNLTYEVASFLEDKILEKII